MDLISWSLNSIDKVFSTLRNGEADPSCPEGTHAVGYTNDPWGQWRLVCLSQLSVEDVEDVYLFGFMVIGFLAIGIAGFVIYRAVSEEKTARGKPPELCGEILEEVRTLSEKLTQTDQRHWASLAQSSRVPATFELERKMDNNLERLSGRIEGRLA